MTSARMIVAALTLFGIVFGLLLAVNPLHTGEPVGGVFFNLILLGYGFPAVLAIALALTTRDHRPMSYRWIAAATAFVLSIAYLTLEVRTLYHGPVLTIGRTSNAEQYTYSAVWLAYRRRAAARRHLAALAAGAACLGGGDGANGRQGVPDRHGRPAPAPGGRCRSSGSAWCWSASAGCTSGCCSRGGPQMQRPAQRRPRESHPVVGLRAAP